MFLQITIYNLFNFEGGRDVFLGQLCLLLGKITSYIHLLTLIPSKLFLGGRGGGGFILTSNNNIIHYNTLAS
jgi:hypothetical protein